MFNDLPENPDNFLGVLFAFGLLILLNVVLILDMLKIWSLSSESIAEVSLIEGELFLNLVLFADSELFLKLFENGELQLAGDLGELQEPHRPLPRVEFIEFVLPIFGPDNEVEMEGLLMENLDSWSSWAMMSA